MQPSTAASKITGKSGFFRRKSLPPRAEPTPIDVIVEPEDHQLEDKVIEAPTVDEEVTSTPVASTPVEDEVASTPVEAPVEEGGATEQDKTENEPVAPAVETPVASLGEGKTEQDKTANEPEAPAVEAPVAALGEGKTEE